MCAACSRKIAAIFYIPLLLCLVSCSSHSENVAENRWVQAEKKYDPPALSYAEKVLRAVQPYWAFTTLSPEPFRCEITVKVSPSGEVLSVQLVQSSGNPQFDNSALNAIKRTSMAGAFPPPAAPGDQEISIAFNMPGKKHKTAPSK